MLRELECANHLVFVKARAMSSKEGTGSSSTSKTIHATPSTFAAHLASPVKVAGDHMGRRSFGMSAGRGLLRDEHRSSHDICTRVALVSLSEANTERASCMCLSMARVRGCAAVA